LETAHAMHPASLPPGSIVGSWRLRARGSQGSYGVVFRRRTPSGLQLATTCEGPEADRPIGLRMTPTQAEPEAPPFPPRAVLPWHVWFRATAMGVLLVAGGGGLLHALLEQSPSASAREHAQAALSPAEESDTSGLGEITLPEPPSTPEPMPPRRSLMIPRDLVPGQTRTEATRVRRSPGARSSPARGRSARELQTPRRRASFSSPWGVFGWGLRAPFQGLWSSGGRSAWIAAKGQTPSWRRWDWRSWACRPDRRSGSTRSGS